MTQIQIVGEKPVHFPEPEQANCCVLGRISRDLVLKARVRRAERPGRAPAEMAMELEHAEAWAEHYMDAHPDRDVEPFPGCPNCLEYGLMPDAPRGLPAPVWDREKRRHRVLHLLLPTNVVAYETSA